MTNHRQHRNTSSRIASNPGAAFALSLVIAFGLTIFAGAPTHAQTYTAIGLGDQEHPESGVSLRGDFVYVTTAGGVGNCGGVLEIKHLGNLVDNTCVIVTPQARVVFGTDAHPYGTANSGGNNNLGSVYYLIPNPTVCKVVTCRPWLVNVVHEFSGFPSDGAKPGFGDLTWDQQGNIYGTTTSGGTKEFGVVYELMPPVPPSKIWTESVIWNFTGPDGQNPQNAVIFDGKGNLLGTAKQGGANGFGTIFKLTRSGNTWTETNVYDFQGGNDGRSPIAGLMIDARGNLYGTTSDGGSGGGGTVFQLTPSGSSYAFKLLYSFSGQPGKNCGPWGTLAMDGTGNLYGTTYCDGLNSLGNIFKLTENGNSWVYTSLHDFPGYSGDIQNPISNVSIEANGNLWGTASSGGVSGGGVWRITP